MPVKESLEIREAFKKNLIEIRGFFRYSQQYVADHIGVSWRSVAYYEAGQTFPSRKVLAKIADLFGISEPDNLKKERCFEVEEIDVKYAISILEERGYKIDKAT